MIHVRCEPLFPAGIPRFGITPAYISRYNSALLPHFTDRPFQIDHVKPAIFPISDGLFPNQAIKIDCDENAVSSDVAKKSPEPIPPVRFQNRARTAVIG